MARAESKLTIKKLATLKPRDKGEVLRDGGGLVGIVGVAKDGETVTVRFTYQYRDGVRRREKSCGVWTHDDRRDKVPGSKGLAEIRTERDRLRALVKAGIDPIQQEEQERERQEQELAERQRALVKQKEAERREGEAMTMDGLYELWDANHGATLEPHWRAVRRSHWRCHVSPVIGAHKVHHADKQPMLLHYDRMVRKGKEVTARRVLALLKQVIAWGVERQHVADDHPLTRLTIPKKQRTVRADQLPENFDIQQYLNARGDEAVGSDLEDSLAGRALPFAELVTLFNDRLPKATQAITGTHLMRLMLATGIRSSEAVRLRWQWIDLDRRLMIIPAGSMKKRKMHHIHLSSFAVRQLEEMRAIRTGDFVFPAPRKENDHILRTNVGNDISSRQFYRAADESDEAFAARLAKRMVCRRSRKDYDLYNLPGGKWTLYDLRRTVATRLEELGIERDMVGRVLAHAQPDAKTTGRYARHSHWEQRCKALDLLGVALDMCEAGELPLIEVDNVVRMRRA
ncbi:tyrosine-type recombinase/integrase [Crenobacter cavernae]|uniref:Tyr recombinase domain-containing protein n=1 Tax=Crenobacter cavernae TaxID=2290923 RepID=A0A345Y5W5_9NEIS|nr:tyrosine-type recombinase/integrase [Crenobacter cavernae]AXK39317.1 hypothetical protein DWG20_07670 [Crenobacter cavernae]